ncbi:MAG: hypothetical protein KBS35_00135 [Mycoplasma sp.]|nr:hypothetical protein [Candidatus Hennigella equi]
MKKLHVLIPSLVATASMPLIGLVGCGNPTPPEPEPQPIDGPVLLDKWSSNYNFLYKNNLYCTDEQEVSIITNFKDHWDPMSTQKKKIIGEFHIINDSKASYYFSEYDTTLIVGGQTLSFDDDEWTWGREYTGALYVKILSDDVIKQLINTERVEIKTFIGVGYNPEPFGFYAI